MVTPVRLAMIGAGAIGRKHISIINDDPTTELVAIVEPDAAAEDYARSLSVPRFDDIDSMLNTVSVDGALVATPNNAHASAGIACAERGVHLLVEKPLADTVAAAEKLAACADKNNVYLLVGHHRRHNPIIRKAREIVQSGEIGDVVAVSAQWLICKPDDYYNVSWRSQAGGGPVLINLIHDIDSLRYIIGDIVAVQAMTSNSRRGFEIEDTAALIFRFESGALGTITLSDSTPAPWSWETASGENNDYPHEPEAHCYLIAGHHASLAVPSLKRWCHKPNRDWKKPFQRVDTIIDHADPLVEQIRHFASVIRGKEDPRITGADGARTLAVTLAVRDAAASGQVIEL